MCLYFVLVSIFLFVSAVLSDPLREKDRSWIPNLVKNFTNDTSDGVYYSDKFAGAFLEGTDGDFTYATATFNISASSGQHDYTMWVGIDGIIHYESWFAAGISAFVTDNSETTYQAWYEWGGDGPYYSDIIITPEDVIRASLNALSATSGTVTIENLNNPNSQAHVYHLNSTQSLLRREVWWGVALYQANESIPFDTVTITNATAYGPSGSTYDAEGATKAEIMQDKKVVTSVKTEGSTVTISAVHE